MTLAEQFIESMKKNDELIKSIPPYTNWSGFADSQNVSNVQLGQTLQRLYSVNISVLEYIRKVEGEALYEPDSYSSGYSTSLNILVWFKFKFEQDGNQIKISNLSEKSICHVSSMTAARRMIRELF